MRPSTAATPPAHDRNPRSDGPSNTLPRPTTAASPKTPSILSRTYRFFYDLLLSAIKWVFDGGYRPMAVREPCMSRGHRWLIIVVGMVLVGLVVAVVVVAVRKKR